MSSNFEFGMRELYSCSIKATSNMKVNSVEVVPNETIAFFDKILLLSFDDTTKLVTAHGGYQDKDHVFWESTKDVQIKFTQGIFSNSQLSIMTNRRMVQISEEEPLYLNKREKLESDENGLIVFSYEPMDYCFLYNAKTGEKINFEAQSTKSVKVSAPYMEVVADYAFQYNKGASRLIIGQTLSDSFVSFEGRTRVKDDISGQDRTGILHIPKLKLMSDISMRLGKEASPVVGQLSGIACPVGPRGNQRVMTLTFLNDDIDLDM